MAKSKKNSSGSIVELLFGLSILLAIWIWASTGNSALAVAAFAFCILATIVGVMLYGAARNRRLVESGIDVVDRMSGEEFEAFLLAHFKKLGYQGHLTPTTADYGADLVLEKDSRKVVAQAKRWKRTVGIEAVQQIAGAIKHYDATNGMVITNSTFTENAYDLARSNGVELWDRDRLIDIMRTSNGNKLAHNMVANSNAVLDAEETKEEPAEVCPNCESPLIIRNGRRGRFWGCSSFPRCRFTKDLG